MKEGQDSAKTMLVTGATGMLGRATAIDLAFRGADVVLACRDHSQGTRVLDEVKKAGPGGSHRLVIGDLSNPDSVRALAAQVRNEIEEIHDKAAHALGALALNERYVQETGRFYNFEKLVKPPKNSEDVQVQRKLWEECERLLGIEFGRYDNELVLAGNGRS